MRRRRARAMPQGQVLTTSGAKPTCTQCRTGLDGFTATAVEHPTPCPGAFSVCKYCGALAVYTADLDLRPCTPDERREALADAGVREALTAVSFARRARAWRN